MPEETGHTNGPLQRYSIHSSGVRRRTPAIAGIGVSGQVSELRSSNIQDLMDNIVYQQGMHDPSARYHPSNTMVARLWVCWNWLIRYSTDA